jgi:hypothetical protein
MDEIILYGFAMGRQQRLENMAFGFGQPGKMIGFENGASDEVILSWFAIRAAPEERKALNIRASETRIPDCQGGVLFCQCGACRLIQSLSED